MRDVIVFQSLFFMQNVREVRIAPHRTLQGGLATGAEVLIQHPYLRAFAYGNGAGIGAFRSFNEAKERGFAHAVITDHAYFVAGADMKINTGKQNFGAVLFFDLVQIDHKRASGLSSMRFK